jgi:hypothetical protein
MRHQVLLLCTIISLLWLGCASPRPFNYSPTQQANDPELITTSLFDSKDRTISEADIQRLLNGKIEIPDSLKIAVYKFASTSTNRYYSSYSSNEEYLKTQQIQMDTLVSKLKMSSKVDQVILVPSMMINAYPNMTQLREAAVRLQADLLLVFSLTSDTYYKFKTFQKNESKAFATCETLLMDTRTGIIPHSNIVTRENLVRKENEDWTNEELRKRAENGAILLTLVETGEKVVKFLAL